MAKSTKIILAFIVFLIILIVVAIVLNNTVGANWPLRIWHWFLHIFTGKSYSLD